MTTHTNSDFDVIVIGSGMGGMVTAAALARYEHKVLLLEQAQMLGGLTHTFSRNGFTWDVGLHYCGDFDKDQQFGHRLLDWLSDETVEFRSFGTVYDTLHFPGGFDVSVGRPEEAFKAELKEKFPANAAEIDAYFEALATANNASRVASANRSVPISAGSDVRDAKAAEVERWCGRTTREVIDELVSDQKLAAVLASQWGTYGGRPSESSFCMHAMVIGNYLAGAAYPVGGASAIAKGLVPVIESAGGSARAATAVREIVIEDGRAVGVRTATGEEFRAPVVVSAIGARDTVRRLLPAEVRGQDWATEVRSFKPAVCHFELFFGFEGDIALHGATRSNHWFFDTWNVDDGVWRSTDDPIQMMFASFPSLKDPKHDPGPSKRHTGQCMVLADWSTVAEFADGGAKERPAEWAAFKERVESKLLSYYERRFPALKPLMVFHELGTPLATAAFTAHDRGGFYGIEVTPRRMLTDSLKAPTPVPGLFLSGQDVVSPGILGALAGGMMCAAAIDPRVYEQLA